MAKNSKRTFFSGVLLLTLSAAAAKICGVLFKIPLYHILRDEGMGCFNSAYVIYTFFFVFTTSGLPVGMSILISGSDSLNESDRRSWVNAALRLFGAAGALVCLTMTFFSGFYARLVGNPLAKDCIFMLGPALMFVCLSGVFRGYFQGKRNMLPTAVSQLIESLFKTGLGLSFARLSVLRGDSPQLSAAWGVSGIAVGSFLSFVYLLIVYLKDCRKTGKELLHTNKTKRRKSVLKLISVVAPVSAASVVLSLSSVIDLSLVMRRLCSVGYTLEEANGIYGNFSGLALPLFNMPAVLFAPVASAVIPHLSSAYSSGNAGEASRIADSSMRLAILLSAPCFAGLAVLSEPILMLLFDNAAAHQASSSLLFLSPSVLLVASATVAGAVLQACGRKMIPIVSLAAGGCVKVFTGWFLIGRFGINGAPIGTFLCYFTALTIDLAALFKMKLVRFRPCKNYLFPLLCAILCGAAAKCGYLLLSHVPFVLRTSLSIASGGGVYILSLLASGSLDREWIALLPGGGRFASAYKKRINKNEGTRKKTDQGSLQLRGSCRDDGSSALRGRLSVGPRPDAREHPEKSDRGVL